MHSAAGVTLKRLQIATQRSRPTTTRNSKNSIHPASTSIFVIQVVVVLKSSPGLDERRRTMPECGRSTVTMLPQMTRRP